ncbi:protein PRRC1-A-like [Mytilus californianus]|uniref:protein PRRC1-A-like n=1 Tax=Mytilus californianus TaxID=6549 RepID=UPI0022463CDE|nr:protein PRRC1-A-like [Mytilus californianus]
MMEESSDESTEIITKEEADMARQMQEAEINASGSSTPALPTPNISSVSPPTPLPAFMNVSSSAEKEGSPLSTPQRPSPGSAISTPGSAVATPVPSPATSSSIAAPAPIQSPYEASAQIEVPAEMIPVSPQSPAGQDKGLFGWISGNKIMSKVKSSMETMITTLDPGMREIIKSGGDIDIVVTSSNENKVGAVREAFQHVFGRATVSGVDSQATTAAQPVGFTAGLKGAEERIQNLRQQGTISEDIPVVSLEGFIIETLPDRWFEMTCLILRDPSHRVELQTFSQPTPVPAEYILKAQDSTASDYPLRWSGLAKSIGQVIEETNPHIGHSDWQNALTGISRRESLCMASRQLAFMYKERLPTSFVS